MAIRTGLRQGELQELRWNDLSFGPRAYVRVSRSVRRSSGGAREVKTTKGARPRSVPLTSDIVAALLAHRRGARDDALVFPDERGSYFDADRFRRALDEAAKAAKVNKHVHPHLLRHTFASHAMMRGVPVQVIQKWLGHAHVTTTERYAHLRPDSGDELIELLAPGPDPDSARTKRHRNMVTTEVTTGGPGEAKKRRLRALLERPSIVGATGVEDGASEQTNPCDVGDLASNCL
jgi:integrase